MTRIFVTAVFCVAAALSLAQQGQAPVPPDPTANAPAQTTPPTFPEGHTSKTTKASTSSKTSKTNVFRGTVVSQDGAYVLKSGDLVYRLDDQSQARAYEGQKVRIDGSLDKQSNTIRIQNIGTQSE